LLSGPRSVALAGAAVIAAAFLSTGPSPAAATSQQTAGSSLGDTTISNNDLRSGWDQDEPDLSPDDVTAASFGPLFTAHVQGQVYAQPLVVNRTDSSAGTLVIATEDDHVYGFNPVSGSQQ
jgi:hypothetical protein